MSDPNTKPELPADATAEQIEADIAETRARLVDSVDALAAKADVKGQAKEKVGEAKEKVSDATAEAKAKVSEATDQAKVKADHAKEQVAATSKSLLDRFLEASRPVQVAVGATPLALLILVIVRRARR